jgi:hypothetical protein
LIAERETVPLSRTAEEEEGREKRRRWTFFSSLLDGREAEAEGDLPGALASGREREDLPLEFSGVSSSGGLAEWGEGFEFILKPGFNPERAGEHALSSPGWPVRAARF